jgi:Fe-S-cluster formation regulator IscX/YfhJ
LVDVDNASAKIADGFFEEIAKIEEASVRRIYGDFSNPRSKAWADQTRNYPPTAVCLYDRQECIRHLAAPFDNRQIERLNGLASLLEGVDVFGFGEQKTPESFRQACRRFVYTENLILGAANSQDGSTKPLQSPSAAVQIINKIIAEMESDDGWVPLGEVGRQLANFASDFDPRNFGFRKLSELVRKTDAFDIDHPEGRAVRIRAKSVIGGGARSRDNKERQKIGLTALHCSPMG